MSVDACAELVARGDPDRFALAMCAPTAIRGDLLVLFAFNLEVARAPWVTSEEMIAQMRLQWWHDAVAEIYGAGPVRRHEVVTPLLDVVARHRLPQDLLAGLVAARNFDVFRDPHADRAAFDRYLEETSGALSALAGQIAGCDRRQALLEAGWATGLGNLLRATSELARRGRKPLPLAGLSLRALLDLELDDPACEVVRALAADAQSRLEDVRGAKLGRAGAFGVMVGWRGFYPLERVRRDPQSLFDLPEQPVLTERLRLWRLHLTGGW